MADRDTIRDRVVLEADCPRCHQPAGKRCVDIYTKQAFTTSNLVHKARVAVWYKQREEADSGV